MSLSLFRHFYRFYCESVRFIKLGLQSPKAFGIFLLAVMLWPFGVRVRKVIPESVSAQRKKAAAAGQVSVWMEGMRLCRVGWKNFKLWDFHITDDKILHTLYFYYFRPCSFILHDLQKFSRQGAPVKLFKGMKIFEPGCNMGRMLIQFKDYYEADITGADIFAPTINLIKNIEKDANFFSGDVVNSDWIRKLPDRHFDLVVASSFLNHVMPMENYKDFARELCRVSRQIYIHDKDKNNEAVLFEVFKDEFPVHYVMRQPGSLSFFGAAS